MGGSTSAGRASSDNHYFGLTLLPSGVILLRHVSEEDMRTVAAADANREFSKILRDVRNGETIAVTSRGEPVAIISPADQGLPAGRQAAKSALLKRLHGQEAVSVSWSRDELYRE